MIFGGIRCAGDQGVLTPHCSDKLPAFKAHFWERPGFDTVRRLSCTADNTWKGRSSSNLETGTPEPNSQSPSFSTKRESTRHREASSSFRAAQILRPGPLNPILRVHPFPDETDPCCRFSLPTLFCGPDASTLETWCGDGYDERCKKICPSAFQGPLKTMIFWLPWKSHSYCHRLSALGWIPALWHSEHWAEITLCRHQVSRSHWLCSNGTVGFSMPLQFWVDCSSALGKIREAVPVHNCHQTWIHSTPRSIKQLTSSSNLKRGSQKDDEEVISETL